MIELGRAFSSTRALRNPSYRVFFIGQLVSMTGNWMRQTVQAWLVYRLSNSGWWLGAIVFAQQAPAFLLSPLAGIIADHHDRRKVLVWVQAVSMVEVLILSVLVWTGTISLVAIAVLAVLLGVATAFEITTRHAFAVDLVGREDLDSAIALNSITINGSRVIGPALGGVLLPWIGESGCFALNGLSYVPIMFALLLMSIPPSKHRIAGKVNPWKDFKETVQYLSSEPPIVRLLVAATLLTFFVYPFNVLLPIYAKDILHGDAHTLAWMTGLTGAGAVLVAFSRAAAVRAGDSFRKPLAWRFLWTGFSFVTLSVSKNIVLSLAAVSVTGFATMGCFLITNNSIQQRVADSMRGRVMSLYTMTFLGAAPLAALIGGWLADHLGVVQVTLGSALVFVAMGAYGLSPLAERELRGATLAKPGTPG